MGPFAKLVRNQTRDIQGAATSAFIIHSAVPSHLFAAKIAGIRLALEEHPSLAIGPGRCITVIDRTLPGCGLVACRIEPRFDSERLRIRLVQRRIPRDFGPGGEIEKLSAIPVAGERAGKGMHHPGGQIVGGIARRAQTAAVSVDGGPAGVIVESIIRARPVAEDRGLVVGALTETASSMRLAAT